MGTGFVSIDADADGMVAAGAVDGALSLYAANRQYDKLFEV
jgi:hypothetical protein